MSNLTRLIEVEMSNSEASELVARRRSLANVVHWKFGSNRVSYSEISSKVVVICTAYWLTILDIRDNCVHNI
ncbi:hypothetical protein WICPIJ_006048 [Wickerhamomyces pijperi]|uniref:Uncharacterized protein n=1 Tax=Wickerhamomyces pijperi TaxID=599730 RepID=A0A9P8Q2U8_WICPI|nr:hypothetical protein WICPIJ_006048 [Wickerhamomyces pijperi]